MSNRLFSDVFYKMLEEYDDGWFSKNCVKDIVIPIDDVAGWFYMTTDERSAIATERILENCPLFYRDGELLVGASTVEKGTVRRLAVSYRGADFYKGVSHTTLNFRSVIKDGLIKKEIEIKEKLERDKKNLSLTQIKFLKSLQSILQSMKKFHQRYVDFFVKKINNETNENKKQEYQAILDNFINVPYNPASNFKEAVQSLWFTISMLRNLGVWTGIGRLDEMLTDFYYNDLEKGLITYEEARLYIGHFFYKGTEWAKANDFEGQGDNQYYQNILLAGTRQDGSYLFNDVTKMIMDVLYDTKIADFPIAVRIGKNTPLELYRRITDIVKLGRGIIAVYNEDLVIKNLVDFGIPYEDAVNFTNDGCWEILIPGKTSFSYASFDGYYILQESLGIIDREERDYNSIDEIIEDFKARLIKKLDFLKDRALELLLIRSQERPSAHLCLFIDEAIENARNYYEYGPKYTIRGIHPSSFADIANSLIAIDRICFKEKKYTFKEYMKIVKNNFEGYEELRQYVLYNITYYGNDNDEADSYITRIFGEYKKINQSEPRRHNIWFPTGSSSFLRELSEYLDSRGECPFGKLKGEVLASNSSPTPGTDIQGPTAALKSFCKLNFNGVPNGAALDLKINAQTVKGENGTIALIGLYKAFVELNGIFMQPDVVDQSILEKAYNDPEKYANLTFRISGWSARFITLSKEFQKMLVDRSIQNV